MILVFLNNRFSIQNLNLDPRYIFWNFCQWHKNHTLIRNFASFSHKQRYSSALDLWSKVPELSFSLFPSVFLSVCAVQRLHWPLGEPGAEHGAAGQRRSGRNPRTAAVFHEEPRNRTQTCAVQLPDDTHHRPSLNTHSFKHSSHSSSRERLYIHMIILVIRTTFILSVCDSITLGKNLFVIVLHVLRCGITDHIHIQILLLSTHCSYTGYTQHILYL